MVTPKLTFVFDRKGQATKVKTGVVELRITNGKVRKYISTGVRLFPKEWSDGSVVGRKDWKELNDMLQVLKRKCSEIIIAMMDEGSLDLNAVPGLLSSSIMQQRTFISYIREISMKKYLKVTAGTKEHYLLFIRFMEGWGGIVSFSDITEKNIILMDEELSRRGLKECTRWNYHKLLKSFILRAVEDGIIKCNPYSKVSIRKGNESGLTRYLTPKEFHNFEKCIIPSESLRKVRDLFVFQTYTCLRYSDLARFNSSNISIINGTEVYRCTQKKTRGQATIPLLQPALDILEKYKGFLPVTSNPKYNEYLKVVAQAAGINKPLSTHWARHTGATILLNEGVDLKIVSKICGHSSMKITEQIYAKLLDETVVDAIKNRKSNLK